MQDWEISIEHDKTWRPWPGNGLSCVRSLPKVLFFVYRVAIIHPNTLLLGLLFVFTVGLQEKKVRHRQATYGTAISLKRKRCFDDERRLKSVKRARLHKQALERKPQPVREQAFNRDPFWGGGSRCCRLPSLQQLIGCFVIILDYL